MMTSFTAVHLESRVPKLRKYHVCCSISEEIVQKSNFSTEFRSFNISGFLNKSTVENWVNFDRKSLILRLLVFLLKMAKNYSGSYQKMTKIVILDIPLFEV